MKKTSIIVLITLIVLFVSLVNAQRIDSDGDGVLDEYDNCPDTNPAQGLPIINRNPELIGCSCSQILKELENNYCVDVFCFAERPLEIRDRQISSRPNPCPAPRCEGSTLYEYETGTIRCIQGEEESYECEEIITRNAEECMNNQTPVQEPSQPRTKDLYDVIINTYLDESKYIELLNMKNKETLIQNNLDVLRRVSFERQITTQKRTINEREIVTKEISITVMPKKYNIIKEFILIEQIKGNLENKNLVINNEYFFDEENQIIIWRVDELNKEKIFTYKITPSTNITYETIVQGRITSQLVTQLVLPILLLTLIIAGFVFWIINKREKNNVFKT